MATTWRRRAGVDAAGGTTAPDVDRLLLERVCRWYGSVLAVGPLNLRIGAGAVAAVHGANGSGKTTLLRLAAGLLRPSAGRRVIHGPSLYLRSGDGVRDAETARQALRFAAAGRDVDHDAVIEDMALTAVADMRAAALSAGQRSRVTLAVAAVCRTNVVCLDEPTAHLDEDGRLLAARVVEDLASRGSAVLVATHDPSFLSGVADAVVRLSAPVVEVS